MFSDGVSAGNSAAFPGRRVGPTCVPCGVRGRGQRGYADARNRHVGPRVAIVAGPGDQEVRMTADAPTLDPNRLTPEQAAKLLSAAAKVHIPVEHILKTSRGRRATQRWHDQLGALCGVDLYGSWDMATDPRRCGPANCVAS